MKKLIFLLLFLPIICEAQEQNFNNFIKDSTVYIRQKTFTLEQIKATDQDYELQFIRFCNKQFYKQLKTVYFLWGASIITGLSPEFINFEKGSSVKTVSWISAGLGILSIFVFIDADKWLKYSAVKPAREGLGIVITF
jgi:hypothetical protein